MRFSRVLPLTSLICTPGAMVGAQIAGDEVLVMNLFCCERFESDKQRRYADCSWSCLPQVREVVQCRRKLGDALKFDGAGILCDLRRRLKPGYKIQQRCKVHFRNLIKAIPASFRTWQMQYFLHVTFFALFGTRPQDLEHARLGL